MVFGSIPLNELQRMKIVVWGREKGIAGQPRDTRTYMWDVSAASLRGRLVMEKSPLISNTGVRAYQAVPVAP